jgi:8-oxo-(d)GTP phosphatase
MSWGERAEVPLILLRHAKAVKREDWLGEDEDRPLSQQGQLESVRVIQLYRRFGIKRIVSSDAIRCLDTVKPLSFEFAIPIETTSRIREETFKKNRDKVEKFTEKLFDQFREERIPTLICGHNPVLPFMLKIIVKKSDVEIPDYKLQPGDGWIVYIKKRAKRLDFHPIHPLEDQALA